MTDPGQTERWNLHSGVSNDQTNGAGSTKAGAASVLLKWTSGGTYEHWAAAGVSVKPCGSTTTSTSTPAPGWYDCAWNYRQSITIDRTKVTGSLTNFPVLISLASDPDLSSHARADGNDIVFTASDGTTKLPHEIENYTPSSGALIAWVKVPSISNVTNTDIYMYYGNSTMPSQQNVTAVWINGYVGVWHLNNSFADSTGHGHTLVNHGTINAPGQLVYGRYFDGTDSINITDSGSDGVLGAQPTITVSGWANIDSSVGAGSNIELISLADGVSIRLEAAKTKWPRGFYSYGEKK
jgi:hypothetical protein